VLHPGMVIAIPASTIRASNDFMGDILVGVENPRLRSSSDRNVTKQGN
jgi:hypothetical protein